MKGILAACTLFLFGLVYYASQEVPKRPGNAYRIEVVLMAEDCEWIDRTLTLIDGLECVRGKIDERLEELNAVEP